VEYLYNTDDRNRTIAEALQSMWAAELGVTVKLVNQDWAVVLQSCFDGDYQMACGVWIADYNAPSSFLDIWQTGGGNNIAHYSDAEFDRTVEMAKTPESPAERMRLLHRRRRCSSAVTMSLRPVFLLYLRPIAPIQTDGVYYSPAPVLFFGTPYVSTECALLSPCLSAIPI
jgi:oligopeptide transport system substrate-binding protein